MEEAGSGRKEKEWFGKPTADLHSFTVEMWSKEAYQRDSEQLDAGFPKTMMATSMKQQYTHHNVPQELGRVIF